MFFKFASMSTTIFGSGVDLYKYYAQFGEVPTVLIGIAIILFVGFLVTRITKLLKLPNVTAYILAGVILGPWALGALSPVMVGHMAALSDDQLRAKTVEFQQALKNGKTLNDIKYEAFAVAREAAKRTLGQFPFKVQIIGALVLNNGFVAEMKTGEGKTLTATMTVYLNALTGNGVHVVTVNEYLAARDADWMGQIYRFLGLTVGVNLASKTTEEKRQAYLCDITYTTNSELGFDYLRDNMKHNMMPSGWRKKPKPRPNARSV